MMFLNLSIVFAILGLVSARISRIPVPAHESSKNVHAAAHAADGPFVPGGMLLVKTSPNGDCSGNPLYTEYLYNPSGCQREGRNSYLAGCISVGSTETVNVARKYVYSLIFLPLLAKPLMFFFLFFKKKHPGILTTPTALVAAVT